MYSLVRERTNKNIISCNKMSSPQWHNPDLFWSPEMLGIRKSWVSLILWQKYLRNTGKEKRRMSPLQVWRTCLPMMALPVLLANKQNLCTQRLGEEACTHVEERRGEENTLSLLLWLLHFPWYQRKSSDPEARLLWFKSRLRRLADVWPSASY